MTGCTRSVYNKEKTVTTTTIIIPAVSISKNHWVIVMLNKTSVLITKAHHCC